MDSLILLLSKEKLVFIAILASTVFKYLDAFLLTKTEANT